MPGALSASYLAKLGDPEKRAHIRPEDIAHGLMVTAGWDLGLLCGSLAQAGDLPTIVFGGGTLRGNPVFAVVLQAAAGTLGKPSHVLEEGLFAGALGALELAADAEA